MVEEITGQKNLYPITPEQRLEKYDAALKAQAELFKDMVRARGVYEAAKKRHTVGKLDAEKALGVTDHQKQAVFELEQEKKASVTIHSSQTNAQWAESRRTEKERRAIAELKDHGILTNIEMAARLGLDPHGVAGVLGKCSSIERVHSGNLNNERMSWKLKEPNEK